MALEIVRRFVNGAWKTEAAEGGGGGSQPSNLAIQDLGTFNAVDLIGGGQVLLSVPIGTYVQILFGTAGYVAPDNGWQIFADIQADYDANAGLSFWESGPSLSQALAGTHPGWVIRGTPIMVSVGHVYNVPDAWQANHTYLTNHYILGPDSHYWIAVPGGLSGPTIPDFASNEGNQVVDNEVTWIDNGVAPTQGTVHLYAITATP